MYSRTLTTQSTKPFSAQIDRLRQAVDEAEAVLVGAGAGLSASAGLTYSGERFETYFADFIDQYHYTDMYSAGFYPYSTPEEYWAYWSRHIYWNRYDQPAGRPLPDLLTLLNGKDYFVITTNVDHLFQKAGFDKHRLFYTQGDYGLWQCSVPCHDNTYDNEESVRRMISEQADRRIPPGLIPLCPRCGKPMTMNLRCNDAFVQDDGWHMAASRYDDFVRRHQHYRMLYLELGVGGNTPMIIKYPFWRMTGNNPEAVYACINLGEAACPMEIERQSICIDADIGRVLELLK